MQHGCAIAEGWETGKMALGTGTHKGSPSWCPECAGRWDWQASTWAWGNSSCVLLPLPYIMFPKFIPCSHLSEIPQSCRRKEVVFRLHKCRKDLMVSVQCASVQTNLERAEKLLFPMRCSAQHCNTSAASQVCNSDPVNCVMSFQDRREAAALCRRQSAATSSLRCNTAGMGRVPALSPGSRSSNIPPPPSHVHRRASSVQFCEEQT